MGLFCASVHLKCEDPEAVEAALADGTPAVVLEPQGGWVSVYADGLVESGPEQLAATLSAELQTDSIAFSVHDSDIARYWLHQSGQLVDSYNSWPGYFEGAAPHPTGGNLEALAAVATTDRGVRDLRRVLAVDRVFADDLVEQLAEILGITPGRASGDYRDLAGGGDADYMSAVLAGATEHFQPRPTDAYDASAVALVEAAATGATEDLTRFVDDGADPNDAAPGPLPGGEVSAQGFSGMQPEMTPLIAAIVNRRLASVETLLDLGADPNALHHLHGSAVHVAAAMGYVPALAMLLDRGGLADAPGLERQTPLQALAAGKQGFAMMDEARQLMDSLGIDSSMLDQLGGHSPTSEEWDQCEALLNNALETSDD